MKYKGIGKHSTEELEQIIDEIKDELAEKRIDEQYNSTLFSNLQDLVRELYFSCDVKPDKEDEAIDICKNLKRALEEFSVDNNFSLK